jgi:uncharacterized lipoprotein YajG
MKRIVLLLALLALSGCTYPISYAPSNLSVGAGPIAVDTFTYTALKKGISEANEVEKSTFAMGNIYLSQDIETLYTDAVRKELRFSGHTIQDKHDVTVTGTIDRFLYDWVGLFTVDFDLVVTYNVLNHGKSIYKKTIIKAINFPKTGVGDVEAMKSTMSQSIAEFIKDAHGKKVF